MYENENIIRISAFVGMLILMLCLESLIPRRNPNKSRWSRRLNNLLLIILTTLAIRFLLPVLATLNMAGLAKDKQWGLLNQIELPLPVSILIAIILLDLLIYAQHVLFHKVPILWRLHRVHHSDQDLDVTTGIRFHPIEILLSLLIKAIGIAIIGAPALAVLIFELLLNITPMFNHSNINIPEKFDRYLRWFIVTPDMHRIHHSIYQPETDSNYGFSVPWWDRLFKTYTANPRDGQTTMTIGLDHFPGSETIKLHTLLLQPFKNINTK